MGKPVITAAHTWETPRFSGWAVDVKGYEHSPGVELDLRGSFLVADFIATGPGATSFLLVNLDEEMRGDVPDLMLTAIKAVFHG